MVGEIVSAEFVRCLSCPWQRERVVNAGKIALVSWTRKESGGRHENGGLPAYAGLASQRRLYYSALACPLAGHVFCRVWGHSSSGRGVSADFRLSQSGKCISRA